MKYYVLDTSITRLPFYGLRLKWGYTWFGYTHIQNGSDVTGVDECDAEKILKAAQEYDTIKDHYKLIDEDEFKRMLITHELTK